jgi:uncharacterized DUF497 family protein
VATVTFGDFEWDSDKAAGNAAKHGVTFEEATTVFLDLDYLLIRDALEPERFVAIGMSSQARVPSLLRTGAAATNHQRPACHSSRTRDL